MPFSTHLFQQMLEEKQQAREKERLELLSLTMDAIREVAPQFSVKSAYITGSIIAAERFHSRSDIDIAVTGLTHQNYLSFMARLQDYLPRQVEVIELEKYTFAQKIVETGLKVLG